MENVEVVEGDNHLGEQRTERFEMDQETATRGTGEEEVCPSQLLL